MNARVCFGGRARGGARVCGGLPIDAGSCPRPVQPPGGGLARRPCSSRDHPHVKTFRIADASRRDDGARGETGPAVREGVTGPCPMRGGAGPRDRSRRLGRESLASTPHGSLPLARLIMLFLQICDAPSSVRRCGPYLLRRKRLMSEIVNRSMNSPLQDREDLNALRTRLIKFARPSFEATGDLTLSRRELAGLAGVAPQDVSRAFRIRDDLIMALKDQRSFR